MHQNNTKKKIYSQLIHWNKKNIVGELPIVGPWMTEDKTSAGKQSSKKLISALVMYGGMYLYMGHSMPMMENKAKLKESGNMLLIMQILMFMSHVSFNLILAVGEQIHDYCYKNEPEGYENINQSLPSPNSVV